MHDSSPQQQVKPARKPQVAKAPSTKTPPHDQTPPQSEEPVGVDITAWINGMPSWMLSMVVHMLLLVVLALVFVPGPPRTFSPTLELAEAEQREELEKDQAFELKEPLTPESAQVDTRDDSPPPPEPPPPGPAVPSLEAGITKPELFESSTQDMAPSLATPLAQDRSGGSNDPYGTRFQAGDGTGGDRGGPPDADEAVDRALAWLAAHQMADGGWSFDHTRSECQNRCGQPGTLTESRNAATGLALLAFLGRGNTHQEGEYQQVVRGGLQFLITRMQRGPVEGTGSLYEPGGRMYSHGLATIALCEAYGMSQDRWVGYPAQHAVNFVIYAQDPVGGGWRYEVHEAGDTSVVGWQLMALKSAQLAGLEVRAATYEGAVQFLNAVQSESGAAYGYTSTVGSSSTTSIGLLSRMYLGWRRDHGALERGGQVLSAAGPSQTNLYYNYYATQVLLHLDNPENPEDTRFDDWDNVLRPWLVETQEQAGHLRGSWYVQGDHGSGPGGRLYCTAMAALTLEVYYRISPIYQQELVELDFPL